MHSYTIINILSTFFIVRSPAIFGFLNKIDIRKGDAFYVFSDGFADQVGGPKQKKFMSVQLRETLVAMASLPMLQQGEKLNVIFEEWRDSIPQIYDVTLIGVRY
jgi:serine phosphatase RsbU (regulator of sigma subunit)